jgi:hypothetical protein
MAYSHASLVSGADPLIEFGRRAQSRFEDGEHNHKNARGGEVELRFEKFVPSLPPSARRASRERLTQDLMSYDV